MFSNNSKEHLQEILDLENSIDQMERDLQEAHVERLKKGQCRQEAGMLFSDIISGLERVADHATNIAFSILDEERKNKIRIIYKKISLRENYPWAFIISYLAKSLGKGIYYAK